AEVQAQPGRGQQEGYGMKDAAAARHQADPPGRDLTGARHEAGHETAARSEEARRVRPEQSHAGGGHHRGDVGLVGPAHSAGPGDADAPRREQRPEPGHADAPTVGAAAVHDSATASDAPTRSARPDSTRVAAWAGRSPSSTSRAGTPRTIRASSHSSTRVTGEPPLTATTAAPAAMPASNWATAAGRSASSSGAVSHRPQSVPGEADVS